MLCQGCILVVEDDADLREAIRQHVERLGCRVLVAGDGEAALDRLEDSIPAQPCLILADVNMPRLGGVELARAVRAGNCRCSSTTPVVTMSAETRHEQPPGTEAHLGKPFAARDLDLTVARLCRGGPAPNRVAASGPPVLRRSVAAR